MDRKRICLVLVGCCGILFAGCRVLALTARAQTLPVCTVAFPRNTRPVAILSDRIHLRWSRDCMYAAPNFGDSRLVSSEGAVALLGTDSPVPLNRVIALGAQEGELLWSSPWASPSEVAADAHGFYIGGLNGHVERRSPISGDIEWYVLAASARRVFALHVDGPWVYAYTNPDLLQLLDKENGRRVDAPVTQALYSVHLFLPDIAVGDSLRAEDLVKHEIRWANYQGMDVLETPIAVDDLLVVKAGEQVGLVSAVGIKTGETVWESGSQVLSNVVLFDEGVMFLDREGALRRLDASTGSETVLLRYGGGDMSLHSDLEGTVGGYYLAADPSTRTLYVLVGDSGQLDAYRVDPEP